MHLGQNICQIREIRHVKQIDMARRLGMTQQAYSKIERCAIVGRDMLERIAKELDVTQDAFSKFNGDQLIENICGTKTITIQVVLNYTIRSDDPLALTNLTEEIEALVCRRNMVMPQPFREHTTQAGKYQEL